jgi:hypothetical protein
MLCSFVNRAAHPATPLESNSCTSHTSNSPGITSLHKNRGGGVLPPTNPVAPASPPLNLPLLDVLCLGDWIHLPSDKMQESRPTQRSTIQSTRPNHCHHERSEVLCAIACLLRDVLFGIARLLRDESAFLFRSVASAPSAGIPQLTQRASFPILLLQMNPRIHRHHHHHGTAPRLMRCA